MVEEVEPEHESIVWVKAFNHLCGDLFRVPNEGVSCRLLYLLWIEGTLKCLPVLS